MRRVVLFAVAASLVSLARPLRSQGLFPLPISEGPSASDVAAYLALSSTPIGGLPPMMTAQVNGPTPGGFAVRAQFGYIDEDGPTSRRILGGGLDIAVGRSTFGVTGGYVDFACDQGALDDALGGTGPRISIECKGGLMAGVNWTTPLVTTPLGASGNTTLVLGVDGAAGYGSGDLLTITATDPNFPLTASFSIEARALSAGLGLPVALVAKSGALTLVPHLTPRIGYGRATIKVPFADAIGTNTEETESGARFMLGGGLDLHIANSGLGVSVGFQKVFVDGGNTLIGAGLSYAMR